MPSPTLIDILNKTAKHFRNKGIENFRLDAQLLLGNVLNLDRVALYLNYDRPLTEKELERCRQVVRRRAAREPLQHILGKVEFRKLTLKVDKRALIPRRETELIVDAVRDAAVELGKKTIAILDIGVGTGAIYLSLIKEFPDWSVSGVELSEYALTLAQENALLNGISSETSLKNGDTFHPFPPEQKWDIVVSNPPYVPESDFKELEDEVRLWDPREALIGGPTGLEYLYRLLREVPGRLQSPGFFIAEIGDNQSGPVQDTAKKMEFTQVRITQDYSGKDRFIILKT